MRTFTFTIISMLVFGLAVLACREGEPVGDPKTPANSPIPKIEKSERDPSTTPTPSSPSSSSGGSGIGDAG